MRPQRSRLNVLAALSALVLVGVGRAPAQLLSKWGHPVFTIGSTPYDSVNPGHGNFPGGPGFIPGYGYYPASAELRYPWMDGPGTPFDRRKIRLAPGEMSSPPVEDPFPADAALLVVKVPAEAEVWINGAPTSQGGSLRRFVIPSLPAGRSLVYTIEARWRIQDAELTRVEEVAVQPGSRLTVNFLTTDSWTGHRSPGR